MKGEKSFPIFMVLTFLASLIMVSVPVKAQDEVHIYVEMPDGYIPGVPVDDMVYVDLYIESPLEWYDTPDGIAQWAVSVKVDPTVLEPMGAIAASSGYFLYDYVATTLDPLGFTYTVQLLPPIVDKTAGTIEWITEGILPNPPTGAGGSGKLVTVVFKSLSETAYSPIDLFYEEGVDAYYWTTEWWLAYPVDIVEDGHYNEPPPEPHAEFTYTPMLPIVDEMITFNASASCDYDGTIVSYDWDFYDGTYDTGEVVTHAYTVAGTYDVTLTVTDNDGLTDTAAAAITVGVHDIAITDVTAFPTEVTAGELVTITVTVINEGDFSEVFSLIVYYDETIINAYNVILNAGENTTFTSTWGTTEVPGGTYVVKAESTVVEGETDSEDNMFIDGSVTIAPPPTPLSVRLSGEHDYLCMERVKIRLAAHVEDTITMEPVSNASVTAEIYDPEGNLWVSGMMVERLAGTGIYEWESEETIRKLRLEKGVYLTHATASSEGSLTASDILEFHIDPPPEESVQLYLILLFVLAVALMISISVWYVDRRSLSRKLSELQRRKY